MSGSISFETLAKPAMSLEAKDYSANTNGASIDVAGFEDVGFLLAAGLLAGTAPTADVKVQDSADNTTFADALQDDGSTVIAFTTVSTANDQALLVGRVRANRLRRYVRLVLTVGGTPTSMPLAGLVVPIQPGDDASALGTSALDFAV